MKNLGPGDWSCCTKSYCPLKHVLCVQLHFLKFPDMLHLTAKIHDIVVFRMGMLNPTHHDLAIYVRIAVYKVIFRDGGFLSDVLAGLDQVYNNLPLNSLSDSTFHFQILVLVEANDCSIPTIISHMDH